MDVKVMSTLGLTDEDVEAIEDVDGIELAEGSYSMDALSRRTRRSRWSM